MTLLSVVQDVCSAVGVAVPTSVFSNITGNRTMREMLALANEMAQRISYDTRDWVKFRKTATLTGDGSTTAFNLPTDFKRMILTANLRRSDNAIQPMRFIPDLDEWLQRRAMNWFTAWGEWTIIGSQINIYPAMGVAVTATFPYMHKNCINLAAGGVNDSFLTDNDVYALDERVLKLGMIWQWKAQKGTAYAEDMGTYGDALTNLMGHDSPAPIMSGHRNASLNARVAYPWTLPT